MIKSTTALVLGGGGVTGIAWETGIIAGLVHAGIDLRGADLVLGTSAGSVVGAQIRSQRPIDDLYADQLSDNTSEIIGRIPAFGLVRWIIAAATSLTDTSAHRKIARMAAHAKTISAEDRARAVAARLPETHWPERPLWITAIDALTGELRVFNRSGEAPLAAAVTASCAVPFA